MERVLLTLQSKKVIPSLEDKLLLKESKASGFLGKIDCWISPLQIPCRLIWNSYVPTKAFLLGKPLRIRC